MLPAYCWTLKRAKFTLRLVLFKVVVEVATVGRFLEWLAIHILELLHLFDVMGD